MPNKKPTLTPIFVDAATKRGEIRNKVLLSLKESFPFRGKKYSVELDNLKIDAKDVSPEDHKNAILRAKTLSEPVRGTVMLRNRSGKVVQKIPNFNLMQLPYFTDHHTFVINGNSYALSNQLRMKPGVYTRRLNNAELESIFNLGQGENFRMGMDPTSGLFHVNYGNRRFPLYPVLNKLGVPDDDIAKTWNRQLLEKNKETYGPSADAHVKRFADRIVADHEKIEGEDPVTAIKRVYAKTQLDPDTTRKTLGKPFDRVNPDAMLAATRRLLDAHKKGDVLDERDNIAFKQLKSADDFVAERVKLEARNLRNKVLYRLERGHADLKKAIPQQPFTKTLRQFMSTSMLSNNPTQINPLEIMDTASRITSLGEGGISSERAIPDEARRLHLSTIGVLDPIRTPESSRAGIDLRASLFTARDENGNLYTPLRDRRGRVDYVPVANLDEEYVAFPNQELKGRIDTIHRNQIRSVPAAKSRYQIPTTHAMYSPASTMIPFIESIDGNRQAMAAKMVTQALPLDRPEAPLVQSASYRHRRPAAMSMEQEIGRLTVPTAPVHGTVSKIRNGYVYIRAGGKEKTSAEPVKVPYYENFPLAAKTYLDQKLTVKPGDTVKPGQPLADSPFTEKGFLAYGKNLRTAYVPMRGMNSNDAVVVSEGAAKKLASKHMFRLGTDLDTDTKTGRTLHQSYFGNKYTKENYTGIDDDGVIKPGTKVNPGDVLIAAVQKSALSPESQMLGRLHKSLVKPYRDASIVWDRDGPGEVIDVARSGRKIRLTVKTKEPAQVGDKIAGRYGNKGVISAVIPDDQMLQDEKGRPIDVALSPLSVISRINPAQVLETAVGRIAEKTGKPVVIPPYSGRNNVKWVKDELKKHGLKDTETLLDPKTGKKIPKILVGPQYTLKLFKTTDTNFSARGVEDYDVNLQPSSGGPKGAKGLGRLEFNALLAHGARNVLREISAVKSQRNDEFWRAYQLGLPLPPMKTSFAYDKFGAMLGGMGIRMDKQKNHISLGPLTDGEVSRMSYGPVKKALMLRAKDLKPEKGGLFDPNVTGGTSGKKWSHVDLDEPVVNPVFERPVKSLLGVTQGQYEKMIRTEGGEGIRKRLASVNPVKRQLELREALPKLRGIQRDKALKELKTLRALDQVKIRPDEAYVLKKLPVIPPIYRPVVPGKGGDLQVSDPNYLYRDTILANEMLRDSKKMPENVRGDARKNLYDSVSALYGMKQPLSPQLQNRNVKGFMARIAGASPKQGFFQQKLIRRKQDISGRGTIAPDSTLGMDEIGLPEDMCWEMYSPFVVRKLVQRGYSAMDAKKLIEERHPTARDHLSEELKERPVLVNRAPALYRYNVLAAYPKPVPGKTVRVHEMLAPIQAGDFDGDAVQISAPVLPEAVNEARRLTLSNMLLSDQQKGTLSKAAPQQESIAGMYAATTAVPSGAKKVFKSKAAAMAAYNRGEITMGTPVEIKT